MGEVQERPLLAQLRVLDVQLRLQALFSRVTLAKLNGIEQHIIPIIYFLFPCCGAAARVVEGFFFSLALLKFSMCLSIPACSNIQLDCPLVVHLRSSV